MNGMSAEVFDLLQVYFPSAVVIKEPDLTSSTLSHQPVETQRKDRNHHRGKWRRKSIFSFE